MAANRILSLARPLLEACALAVPALLFLHYYTQLGAPSVGAHTAHFLLLAAIWAAAIAMRLVVWRHTGARFARVLVTLCCTAIWTLIPLYYLVAMIGLQGWGKIITWPILKPYLTAPSELLHYIGLSTVTGLAGALTLLTAVSLLWFALVGRDDWVNRLQSNLSSISFCVVLAAFLAFSANGIHQFVTVPPTHVGEPVSLTFFPLPPVKYGQSAWPSDSRQLEQENRARAVLLEARPLQRPNVVLIVSDALRADRMGIYGYARPTTPHLARRLATDEHERVRAIATCAETSCGMPALLYSKTAKGMVTGALGLSESLQTLGYRSHMLLSGDHTNYYGLAELYKPADTYADATTQDLRFVNDDTMVLDAIRALPASRTDEPAFLQIHLLSNHPLGARNANSDWFQPEGNYAHWGKRKTTAELTARERVLAGNFYDNGVRQMDLVLHLALRDLEAKGYLRHALVIVTSDHGEALGEHNLLSHTAGVFQQVLDIPMVFIRYGYQGSPFPRRQWASQLDVAPTILRELGIRSPESWMGAALQEEETRTFIPFQQGEEDGFVYLKPPYAAYKYWIDRKLQREHAFDLTTDPAERTNLVASLPPWLRDAWRAQALRAVNRPEAPALTNVRPQ